MTTPVNGVFVLQGIVPSQIAAAPAGVKVIDLYDDNGQLFTASQVAQMEANNSLLLGYFSIGEAEDFRSYFSSLPSSVLGPVDPGWPGDYQVAYWTDAWKTVSTNYVDQMIALGYRGAFFDVVSESETSWAKANAPGGDPEGAMIDLIQYVANYAHAKDPNFSIWVNGAGAENLMTNSSFVNAIDGAFEEELFYQDNGTPQSTASVNYTLNLLDNLVAAGKPVITIEYVTGATAVGDVQAKAAAAGIGSYVADPNLALSGVDTEGFATLPPPSGGPTPPPPVPGITITGTASNDTLIGGAGNDTLKGGTGNDVFQFLGGFGQDIIKDFTPGPIGGQDLLDISGLGITAASFSADVKISAGAHGSTMITIGTNSIRLLNVTPSNIDVTDFRLA
jgi:cysteinyl-tRNA synthetase